MGSAPTAGHSVGQYFVIPDKQCREEVQDFGGGLSLRFRPVSWVR
jgi:hypothetical protein